MGLKETDEKKLEQSREYLEELKELRGGSIKGFQKRLANDPQLIHAFMEQYRNCNKGDNVIPRKYRELMIMLLGCAINVDTTIKTHAKLAYENGATLEEIAEALRIAFFICGVSAIIPASEIFDEIDFPED